VMRPLLLAFLAGMSLLLVAAPAPGKTGVRARLSAGVPLDAPPGKKINVRWTLGYRDEERRWRPGFDACGVFVRLLSASGGRPTVGFDSGGACRAHPGGTYAAIVKVPEGGVGGIRIGLRGTTDVFFPLDRDSIAAPPVAVASTEQSGSRASLPARGVLGLTLASLTALALAAAVHRRRTRATE
jgi:hypothetical protein